MAKKLGTAGGFKRWFEFNQVFELELTQGGKRDAACKGKQQSPKSLTPRTLPNLLHSWRKVITAGVSRR